MLVVVAARCRELHGGVGVGELLQEEAVLNAIFRGREAHGSAAGRLCAFKVDGEQYGVAIGSGC